MEKIGVYASHILKYKYGMNLFTCTWPPILYTDYGYKNFKNWIELGGFDNVSYIQNPKVMKILTKLSTENLLHPFQTFILGQKNYAPQLAKKFGIDLVFFGENEAEYGNPLADNANSLFRDKSFYTANNLNDVFLGGQPIKILDDYSLSLNDLKPYLPLSSEEFSSSSMEIHYLGYYIKWILAGSILLCS